MSEQFIEAKNFGKWFKERMGDERPAKVARILGINRENIYAMMGAKSATYKPKAQTLKRLGLTPMFRVDNPPDFSQPDPLEAKKKKAAAAGKKKNFKELQEKMSPERRERIAARVAVALKDIRSKAKEKK